MLSTSATTSTSQADASTCSLLSGHNSLSPSFQKSIKYLKGLYIDIATPIYDKEDYLLRVKAKSFISIAVVHKDSDESKIASERFMDRLHGNADSIQKKKTKLLMCDVGKCEDGSVARCVLVEGCPGVGKTTFAYELCKQWARGEILQEWKLVVIAKLRDQETREAKDFQNILYHPDPEVSQAVVKELIDTQGRGMLLILDGYDELSDSQRALKSVNVIQQLMSRKLFPQATLMVMSRPLATRELHFNFRQSIDQHIEVLGFTEESIHEYISSACGSKSELLSDFKSYLSSHPFSSSLMFNPLHCAIVTDLYCNHWKHGDKRFAPKTLTELYTGLFHILLLRHLTSNPDFRGSQRIRNLSELPEELQQQVKAITELAARGIENRKYVFDEVDEKVPSETLGLMRREEKLTSGVGISVSYHFLHLTLQEYLAAVKYSDEYFSPQQLSQQLTKKNIQSLIVRFLEHYGKKEKKISLRMRTMLLLEQYRSSGRVSSPAHNHWPLLLFIAGITKLDGISEYLFQACLYERTYSSETIVDVSLLHLLYETQSTKLIQSTLVTGSKKYLIAYGNTALDWFVIGFCIAKSTSTWQVDKKLHIKFQGIDHLPMGLRLASESSYVSNIGCLHIDDYYWLNVMKILKWLQPYSLGVTEIKLFTQHQRNKEKNKEEQVAQIDLMESTYYPALEKIRIEHANGDFLFSILDFRSRPKKFLSLSLYDCTLSIDSTNALMNYLQSPAHCRFHEVKVNECTLSMVSHTDTKNKNICSIHVNSLEFQNSEKKSLITVRELNQPKISFLILQLLFVMNLSHESEENCMTDIAKPFISISSQHNNLQSLSLIECVLNWKAINTLICFLQSPNCRLHELKLDENCKISNAKGKCTPCELKFELKAARKFSLYISSSSQVINCMLSSQPSFYTSTLAELKIKTIPHSGAIKLPFFPVLEKLEIEGEYTFPINPEKNTSLLPSFLSFEENNLSILSLGECNLNHKATMLFIQFLRSPAYCRLRHVSLFWCEISFTRKTKQFGGLELLLEDTEKVSLTVTGCDLFISCILSKLTFYARTLNRLVLLVRSQLLSTATLENAIVNYPMLANLEVVCYDSFSITGSVQFPVLSVKSRQSNLCSLCLKGLNLSSKATCSLFFVWRSPHSRLQELSLERCTIFDNSQQTKESLTLLKLQKLSTRTVSVYADGFSGYIFQLLSQPNFYANILDVTEMRLNTRTSHSHYSSDSAIIIFNIELYYPKLETLQIDQDTYSILPVVLNFGSQTSNLCFLSLTSCRLNSLATESLVDFLQSSHCKLCELTLDKCIIGFNDADGWTYQLRLKLKITENISLNIGGSSFAISHVLTQFQFCSSKLSELIIKISYFCPSRPLDIVMSSYSALEMLQFTGDDHSTILSSSCLNFSSQPNTLHTLSIRRCQLSNEATSALIHSLRSPYCVLSKLILNQHNSIFFYLKQTLLATAIFSCSTIKCFMYGLEHSTSLIELISGIKHNQTIGEFAIKNLRFYSDDDVKTLVEAIDSSAVKKLWLEKCNSSSCFQFSRNVEIVFYSDDNDLFAKLTNL